MSEVAAADATTTDGANAKEKVMKQAAIHRASQALAAAKKEEQKTASGPSQFAQVQKAMIEVELMVLTARLAILSELEPMNDEEKMELLFWILDKNQDGSLSVAELADGLRKIHGDVSFEESIALAMDRVASFDEDGDAKLQYDEFKVYVNRLIESFGQGLNFHELAEMLILAVTFEDGNDAVEQTLLSIAEDDITEALKDEVQLAKVMDDERMRALFNLFDLDSSNSVDFIELVRGLYKITNQLDEATTTAVVALMQFDDDMNDKLDLLEFSRFILNLISIMGEKFDECIFKFTKAAAEENKISDEELKTLLLEMA